MNETRCESSIIGRSLHSFWNTRPSTESKLRLLTQYRMESQRIQQHLLGTPKYSNHADLRKARCYHPEYNGLPSQRPVATPNLPKLMLPATKMVGHASGKRPLLSVQWSSSISCHKSPESDSWSEESVDSLFDIFGVKSWFFMAKFKVSMVMVPFPPAWTVLLLIPQNCFLSQVKGAHDFHFGWAPGLIASRIPLKIHEATSYDPRNFDGDFLWLHFFRIFHLRFWLLCLHLLLRPKGLKEAWQLLINRWRQSGLQDLDLMMFDVKFDLRLSAKTLSFSSAADHIFFCWPSACRCLRFHSSRFCCANLAPS